MFQSPQWGSNSKAEIEFLKSSKVLFQSPQWGSNSKGFIAISLITATGFSPRNGEVILKLSVMTLNY